MKRAAVLTLAGTLALAAPAAAQHACPGHISSTAIRPVPGEARIAVSLRDNSPRQERLRDAVYAVLQRTGHPTGEPAAFRLSWRGSLDTGSVAGRGGPTRADQLFNERDRFEDSDDLSWMQGVPSARGARRGGPAANARLAGNVELREVASGRVVWTAVFSCERQGQDDTALMSALALAVVPIIGQTVSGRAF